ncbi:hypothetical protein DSO57_1023797 [Entomophthora muscae]|uniref:Uncharacterized protein n=1 Tax=Entomophthora muscae TaxID=34485 RepID=A0ACC2SRS8_9FUNG|nr:hypothetical protein DSO57_1023797 [Entomophthora muscae]
MVLFLVKQWADMSAYQMPEQVNLSLILGTKPKDSEEAQAENFFILPTTENEDWSLERYWFLSLLLNFEL